MLLEGRVVLVTGAARGMGRGIAQAVAEEGARVVVTDVRLEDAQQTAEVLAGQSGGVQQDDSALPLALDVTDAGSIRRAMEFALGRFGQLDGLVNNAGVITMGEALRLSPADWNQHFAVNTAGLFECCRAFAELVIRRGEEGGSIVNVSSNAGKVGYPNMAAYNASKAAVINLTRSLAMEWAEHDINVNAVCPGGVDTPMLQEVAKWVAARTGGDADSLLAGMVPHQLGRHVQPVEVGRVVTFLLSDRARIIRGQAINVDGGDTPY